jgi:hypothetical protein
MKFTSCVSHLALVLILMSHSVLFAQEPPIPELPGTVSPVPGAVPAPPGAPATPTAPTVPAVPMAAPQAATASPNTASLPKSAATTSNAQKIPFLRPHFTVPESKESIKKLLGYFEELPRLAEQAASGKAAGKQLATGRALGNKIGRELERLRLYGEPLAVDMKLRSSLYGDAISLALDAYLATPKGLADREKAKVYVTRTAPARVKIIQQLEGLISKGSFLQAEVLLDKTYDDLYPYMAYIHWYDHKYVYDPFAQVQSAINQAMNAKRVEASRVAFQAVIADATARRDALLATIEQGRAEMPQSGNVTIDGQAMPGPVAANALFAKWEQVHVAFLHAQSVEIAGQATGAGTSSGFSGNVSFWAQESQKLADVVQKSVVEWIGIDASKSPAPMAKQRYVGYVQAIAGVSRRLNNAQWLSGFEPALASLATRAELSSAVAAYDKSTAELLRWRARVTAATLQKEAAAFPELSVTSQGALPYDPMSSGFHLTTPDVPRPSIPCLYVAMPKAVPWALSIMQNRPVSVFESFYRLGEQKAWMSRYRQGVYARLATVAEPVNEIGRLKNDLLVDADHPPLTLLAAAAIASAERGEFRQVGGVVVNMGLEGSISRFAVLPAEETSLVDLNQTQSRVDYGDELSGLAIRYDIQPQWLAHEFFFHRVGTP